MEKALTFGLGCISERVISENDAVMFDIDDTLLKTDGTPIPEMIYLFQTCKSLGYKMVIITARPYYQENIIHTKDQLLKNNIFTDKLVFTDPEKKTKAKTLLEYNFILSVGDQYTDLEGSDHSIKLPSRLDNNVYTR